MGIYADTRIYWSLFEDRFWEICVGINGGYFSSTGGGDQYQIWYGPLLRDDKWNRHAIKFDGTTFSYFIDNIKIGFNNSNSPKNTKYLLER